LPNERLYEQDDPLYIYSVDELKAEHQMCLLDERIFENKIQKIKIEAEQKVKALEETLKIKKRVSKRHEAAWRDLETLHREVKWAAASRPAIKKAIGNAL
jgi:hypothetical protein